jgi:hypothetical protein
VTASLLSFWQLAGKETARKLPSLLFVNESPDHQSPAVEAAKNLLAQQGDTTPRVQKEGPFAHGAIEDAPIRMATAIQNYNNSSKITGDILGQKTTQLYLDDFYAAQRTAYGYGRSRPYADSWHEHFGLISDADAIVSLRIESDEDVELLQQHLQDGKTLHSPEGIGGPLAMIPKRIALAGSLSSAQWDFATASTLLDIGVPVISLPDISKGPLLFSNWPPFELLATMWPRVQVPPIGPASQFSQNAESLRHYEKLRKRLHLLPADYEFAILTLTREICSMCFSLVSLAASQSPKESHSKIGETILKLHDEALRGITLGVESLTWHGLGLPIEHPPELAAKVLEALRAKGPLSLRDLQRTTRIPSATIRDEILAALKTEGIVRVQDKKVTAVTFEEFSSRLYARV